MPEDKRSALNPPDSPPSGPVIPEGLATKLGKYAALAGLLAAILVEATGIDLDPDTRELLGGGLAALITLMAGRYAQAYAKFRDVPSVDSGLIEESDDDIPPDVDESVSPPTAATTPSDTQDLPRRVT